MNSNLAVMDTVREVSWTDVLRPDPPSNTELDKAISTILANMNVTVANNLVTELRRRARINSKVLNFSIQEARANVANAYANSSIKNVVLSNLFLKLKSDEITLKSNLVTT